MEMANSFIERKSGLHDWWSLVRAESWTGAFTSTFFSLNIVTGWQRNIIAFCASEGSSVICVTFHKRSVDFQMHISLRHHDLTAVISLCAVHSSVVGEGAFLGKPFYLLWFTIEESTGEVRQYFATVANKFLAFSRFEKYFETEDVRRQKFLLRG